MERIQAILVNVSFEYEAAETLIEDKILNTIEDTLKICIGKEEELVRSRCFHLLSKLIAYEDISILVLCSQEIMVSLFLFCNLKFPDIMPNSIRILHSVLKLGDAPGEVGKFKINTDTFGLALSNIISHAQASGEMQLFVNSSACASGAIACFGSSHSINYLDAIPATTVILSEKLGTERKNAAVFLGHLS